MAGAFGYEAEHYEMSLQDRRARRAAADARRRARRRCSPPAAPAAATRSPTAPGRDARHIVRLLDDASTARGAIEA